MKPRPRSARVEHKFCPPSEWHLHGMLFRGDGCPVCGRCFDPTVMRCKDQELIILADYAPMDHELVTRARCTHCRNLFAIEPEKVYFCSRCYGQVLSERASKALWKRRESERASRKSGPTPECDKKFMQARDVAWFSNVAWEDAKRRKDLIWKDLVRNGTNFTTTTPMRPRCHSCKLPVRHVTLCPLCRFKHSETGCLPQRPMHIWKRIEGWDFDRSNVGHEWKGGERERIIVDYRTVDDMYDRVEDGWKN